MGKASVVHRGAAGHLVSLPCALEAYLSAGSGQSYNLTAVQEPFLAVSDARDTRDVACNAAECGLILQIALWLMIQLPISRYHPER